jgi:hypothetical protein
MAFSSSTPTSSHQKSTSSLRLLKGNENAITTRQIPE